MPCRAKIKKQGTSTLRCKKRNFLFFSYSSTLPSTLLNSTHGPSLVLVNWSSNLNSLHLLPSYSTHLVQLPSSPSTLLQSYIQTHLAMQTMSSIIANPFPTQPRGPILNAEKALLAPSTSLRPPRHSSASQRSG